MSVCHMSCGDTTWGALSWVRDRFGPGSRTLQPLSEGVNDELDPASVDDENNRLRIIAREKGLATKWHCFHTEQLREAKQSHPALLDPADSYVTLKAYVEKHTKRRFHLGRQGLYLKKRQMHVWEYYCAATKCSDQSVWLQKMQVN